jgi:flagellar basal-body rod protein FlgG
MAGIQGLYTAASGMEATQNQFDAISNDLANVDTTGYQSEEVGFQDLLYSSGGVSSGSQLATGAGASSAVVGRDQTEGDLQTTGRSLDVAIEGEGFLQVRRPDGTIGLTRDGSLQLDARGQLTDTQGDRLDPPVTIPAGTDVSKLSISADGQISDGTRQLGRLRLVTVPNPDGLLADGGSQFSATAASGAIRGASGVTLKQGALEGSNVDIAAAMSDMVTAERSYQMSSQAIQDQDQMLQIANQLRSGS